jgi:hypothetical protein
VASGAARTKAMESVNDVFDQRENKVSSHYHLPPHTAVHGDDAIHNTKASVTGRKSREAAGQSAKGLCSGTVQDFT